MAKQQQQQGKPNSGNVLPEPQTNDKKITVQNHRQHHNDVQRKQDEQKKRSV